MPCRTAPAWPAKPPPSTLTTMSNFSAVSVSTNGWRTTMRRTSLGK